MSEAVTSSAFPKIYVIITTFLSVDALPEGLGHKKRQGFINWIIFEVLT
ncbi:hypothetical protein COO91_04126 [Nostoc flagelliforme CCNUN1]|uniref:Uncharacterized protein n=1 Tax=Nostoc flagelliforme CCNUN1 TaxID=2038116 RepID=A0A2K8SRW5_9NOSO|nr:hypothetical protein COO91_04126 [Nostoc flagelliforme CCNUN1]